MRQEIADLRNKLSSYNKYDHVVKKYKLLEKETSDIEIIPSKKLSDLEEKLTDAQIQLSQTIRDNKQKQDKLASLNQANEKLFKQLQNIMKTNDENSKQLMSVT